MQSCLRFQVFVTINWDQHKGRYSQPCGWTALETTIMRRVLWWERCEVHSPDALFIVIWATHWRLSATRRNDKERWGNGFYIQAITLLSFRLSHLRTGTYWTRGQWWCNHLQITCGLLPLHRVPQPWAKWQRYTYVAGWLVQVSSELHWWREGSAGRGGAVHLKSTHQSWLRSRGPGYVAFRRWAVFVYQSGSHAFSPERWCAPEVRHSACRAARGDRMFVGFLWFTGALVELVLVANDCWALSSVGSHIDVQGGHDYFDHDKEQSPGFFVVLIGSEGGFFYGCPGHIMFCSTSTM